LGLVAKQSLASKDANTEAEGSTALQADSRRLLTKTQQTEKT
jgi:hypothetical protein